MEKKFDECPICLDVMYDNIYITSCLHKFHETCYNKYKQIAINTKCPICRHPNETDRDNEHETYEREENDFWENDFYERRRRRRTDNETRNSQRRDEGRNHLNSFINVMSNRNIISSITRKLRRTEQIEETTESLINIITPSIFKLFGNLLTR